MGHWVFCEKLGKLEVQIFNYSGYNHANSSPF
jgi:hypothetical protein